MTIDFAAHLANLERALEALRTENAGLRAEKERLRGRVEELEALVRRNSSNSSMPPSSDRPWNKPKSKPSPEQGKRRRGGQKGHKKHTRELLPPEQVDEVHDVYPSACKGCGASLDPRACDVPRRHQVTEIPVIKPRVDEYRLHSARCARCETVTAATLPKGVPAGTFGPRAIATVGTLTGWFRLSKRNAQQALQMLFGLDMSLGSVSQCEAKMSRALATPVAEARNFVATQPVRHADETSWIEGTKKAWLWVASTSLIAVFLIQARRSGECAKHLLGKARGILVTDRLKSYGYWPMRKRQVCWAHLLREFEEWAQRAEGSFFQTTGAALLEQAKTMFAWWHRVRDGTLARSTFQNYMRSVQREVERLLETGATSGDLALMRKCDDLLDHWPALWTFVRIEGVEPTNNIAERDVRHGVLMRKTSFGTDSPRGSRFIERMLTVVTSLRKQRRDPHPFLVECAVAQLRGTHPPSLLPS